MLILSDILYDNKIALTFSLIVSALITILSILPLAIARYSKGISIQKIKEPRALFEFIPRWGKRAKWAHDNTLESFSLYAPSALLCIFTLQPPFFESELIFIVSFLYPTLRFIYIPAYIFNLGVLRAFLWGGSVFCSGCLYFHSLKNIMYNF